MTGAPMGWVNTPSLYQLRWQQEVLGPLRYFNSKADGAAQWVDDTLLYNTLFDEAIVNLEALLVRIKQLGIS